MLYHLYELNHAAISPMREAARLGRAFWSNPANPTAGTQWGRAMAASCEIFERLLRRYGRPEWGIDHVMIEDDPVAVSIEEVWRKPFCRLLRFDRQGAEGLSEERRTRLLLVAPMSGHYATLLRGTVRDMLPHADIHVTDWADAREVPLAAGRFDLDDYVEYLIDMLHALGPKTHVMAVCQPSVPALAAAAVMSEAMDPCRPASLTLLGGPVDTRINPTAVNLTAKARGLEWFRRNVICKAPFPNPGFMRDVYPGFLQLSGFLAMNMGRHAAAHRELFRDLVAGDGDSAEKHREFYDEYLAVMDLTAEFFLQTLQTVFIDHDMPCGRFTHRGSRIDLAAIRDIALFTVEGERDDISGIGQTKAAHDICPNIPASMRGHHLQAGAGHYGIFNGRRFRTEIAPKILAFMRENA